MLLGLDRSAVSVVTELPKSANGVGMGGGLAAQVDALLGALTDTIRLTAGAIDNTETSSLLSGFIL